MIKTLSPHYKYIPWLSPSSAIVPDKYILNIYAWEGAKSVVPLNPLIELENVNPLGITGFSEVDISRNITGFFSDFLTPQTTTGIFNGNSSFWVKTEVIYYIDGVAQPPEFELTELAVNGYGYGDEGVNPIMPTNQYLATTAEQKVSRNGIYMFHFLASETESTTLNINNLTFTQLPTNSSNFIIQGCYINVSEFTDDFIEVSLNGNLITTLLVTDEFKHSPIDVVFRNKEGQLQSVTLFKEIVDSLKIDRKVFENGNRQPLEGFHQFKTYNTNGRSSFSINSGFIKEDNNEILTQLLLSDKIWLKNDSGFIPINIDTTSFEYKTLNRDRLINYKIDFKYSFNKINNI